MPDSDQKQGEAIYLDNAATSFPKPETVYAGVDAWMRRGGIAFGRGSHAAGDDAAQMVTVCRTRLAKLLNAESSQRIAFTFNCTDGLNLLLRGILRRGDRVVTTDLEHNSVLRPLSQLADEIDVDVVRIGFNAATGVVDEPALIEELTKAPTKLVVLNHASNVTGVMQPVKSITAAAHAAGAMVLLDAAQSCGHVSVDLQDLGVDMMATAGHKGLLGPLGTGIVYAREGLDHQLIPVRCGGTGTASVQLSQPTEMPTKFESGNMNMPGIAGLSAATDWLLQEGVEEIHRCTLSRHEQLCTGLSGIDGIVLVCRSGDAANTGIVSFTIDGVDCREAATILDQSFQIQCRAGLHCAPLVHQTLGTTARGGTLRFSPGPYTTNGEIAAAIQAVEQIGAAF